MDLVDFIVLILAASAMVDVWRNGSVFADLRAYFEARQDAGLVDDSLPPVPVRSDSGGEPADEEPRPFWQRLADWLPRPFVELLNCSYCLSHHTPWVLALLLWWPSTWLVQPLAILCKIPLYSLAATRAGYLINAALPRDACYDREATFLFTGENEDGATEPGATD